MLRKEGGAVPKGNGLTPQQEEFGSGQPTQEEVCRMIRKALEVCNRRFDKMQEYVEDWRSMGQRLTGLEHDARQPRLAMEADGLANTKTRERTEGAQFTRCVGIAALQSRLIPVRRPTRPVSA